MLGVMGASAGRGLTDSQQLHSHIDTRSDMDAVDELAVLIEGVHVSRSSSSSTLSLGLSTSQLTVGGVKAAVASSLRLDEAAFHLLCSTQLLREEHLSVAAKDLASGLSSPLVLRLLVRDCLIGGKGGFGSLLRSATTKVGAKKTSNFSASRDLSGRRMRHVEAERQIAEWNAQEHEPVNQTELSAKYKAIKEGRNLDVKPCKWGATCKYRDSTCRREHPPDPNAVAERGPQTTMPAEVGVTEMPKAVSKRHMKDAVSAGLMSSRKRTRAADDESKSDQEDEDDMQYSASDDDQQQQAEDEPASKRFHHEYLPSAVPAAASSSSSAAAAPADADDFLPFPAAAASSMFASSYVPSTTPAFPAFSHREPELAAVEPVKAAQGLAAVLAKVKKQNTKQAAAAASASGEALAPAAAAAASSSASAVAASSPFDPIDLSAVESIDALAEYPIAHLTHELTRVGLKAGGTQRQKAERLFLLKSTTIDKLPAKVRATPAP